MYNVNLRKKQCILPGKMYHEKNTVFACFKRQVNALYRSVLSSNGIISYIAQIQYFRESQFQKTKTEAPVVINLFFKKYIYLSMSSKYFDQSDQFYQNICTTFMLPYFLKFFLEMFVFVCFCVWFCCCFVVAFVLFFFVFISGQKFSSSIKDTDVTTAAYKNKNSAVVIDFEDYILTHGNYQSNKFLQSSFQFNTARFQVMITDTS